MSFPLSKTMSFLIMETAVIALVVPQISFAQSGHMYRRVAQRLRTFQNPLSSSPW